MKAYEIIETQDYDSLSAGGPFVDSSVDWLRSNGEQWAEAMGGRQVIHGNYHGQDLYGLVDNEKILAIAVFVDVGENYELRLISNTTTSGGNFYPMMSLLFTIKEFIGKPIIDYGSQSKQGMRFLQALDKVGHFNISWVNKQTGEKVLYDGAKDKQGVKPYRDVYQTDWCILIEHTPRGKEEFPREGLTPFGTPLDFFTEEYQQWFENYINT